jgi:hypothetical protein
VVDGQLTDDRTVIQDHIVEFYKKLYSEQYQWRLRADDLSFLFSPLMKRIEYG